VGGRSCAARVMFAERHNRTWGRMDSSLRSPARRGRADCKRDRSGNACPGRGRNAKCVTPSTPVCRSCGSRDPSPVTIPHGRGVGLSGVQQKRLVRGLERRISTVPE
jgi:hypothetical protein